MSRKIPLTQGKFAIVDDEDYEWLNQWKWRLIRNRGTYAVRSIRIAGRSSRQTIFMHRLILPPPPNMEIDHIDGNGLNNRQSNLRVCTHVQNCMNQRKQPNCSSTYKGVSWSKKRRRWRAYIHIDKKLIHLGWFIIEKQAAKAYDKAAKQYFGAFARMNFSGED